MLRLEKLELRGFKSFCDPSEVDLTETVTAIVGPNGCGKSNIVDSITWVLGEQSARLLRGTKMEDVIFQGSRTRKPNGFAEVTLHLVANAELATGNGNMRPEGETDGHARGSGSNGFSFSVAPGERIMLGRRLYRSGESEYRLNGRRVRLRDIQDLFAGTGLGPGHYAIIGQGHVEELLTAKPFERRAVIEAAGGIGKFRLRQRTIELRLQSARQNLLRIDDMLLELERQVRSLRRQAAKARRFRRLKDEWRRLLRFLFAAEHVRIQHELEELEERTRQARDVHARARSTIARLEAAYRQAMDEGRKCESTLSKRREELNSLNLQLERTRSRQASCQEQMANHGVRRGELGRQAASLRERLKSLEQEVARGTEQLAVLSQAVQSDSEQLAAREAGYRTEGERVKATEREIEALRQQLLEETNNNANLRNAAQQAERDLERVESQLKGLQVERRRAAAKQGELTAERASLDEAVKRDRLRVQQLTDELSTLEEELEEVEAAGSAQAETLRSLERERATVDERLGVLEQLDRQYAYCSSAVQRLFDREEGPDHPRLLGTLADAVRVERRHERLVESVLGRCLETILVSTIEDAREAIQFLQETNAGEATFLVVGEWEAQRGIEGRAVSARAGAPDSPPGGEPDGTTLLDLLGLESPLAQSFARGFPELARARLTPDLNTAIERSLSDTGATFVTPDGCQVRAGRFIAGGGEEEGVKSVLAIKREVVELRQRDTELGQEMERARSLLAHTEDRTKELDLQLDQLRSQQQDEQKAALEREMQLAALENDLARSDQHLRVVDFELTQVEKDHEALLSKRKRLVEVGKKAADRWADVKAKHEAAQADLVKVRDEVNRLSEDLSSLRARVAAASERRRGAEADLKRLEQERLDIHHQLQTNAEEAARIGEEQTRLEASLLTIDETIEKLHSQRLEVEVEVETAMAEVERLHGRIDEINSSLDEGRAREREHRERLAQLDIERTQLTSDDKHLAETCSSELDQSLDEVLTLVATAEADDEADVDLHDIDALKDRLQEVRRKLDDMGPVNMMALDELEEQQERLEFLHDQRQDVVDSITSTEKALEEVKRRSRRKFLDAFVAINAHFSEVFQELFGGGQGHMVLLDEASPLESGVDIVAQPPGKRLQNVLLLSGGEKSLTALALLLAIFRYRPSPFCILDEVDAPLDDVNVRRFAKKIVEMSQKTQFILITHNKTTMQVAGTLHGVTMEEPGVSKLVSVRLK